MLIEKNKDSVRILKLINGDEVIAKVTSQTDGDLIVENPFVLIMGQQGMQFSPMLIMGDPDVPVTLYKSSIAANAAPAKNMLQGYEKATSKIAIPSKQGIII